MPKSSLQLNRVMCDWFTFTSYQNEFFDLVRNYVKEQIDPENVKMSSRLQYTGKTALLVNGELFLGTGKQGGRWHHMLQVSGEAAHENIRPIMAAFNREVFYDWRCTRFDTQVTIIQPEGWSQHELMIRQLKRDNEVGWKQNQKRQKGRRITVYMGNRETGHRYARVYQKITQNGEYLLRLEVECKRERAKAIGKRISSALPVDLIDSLKHELQVFALRDFHVHSAFSGALAGMARPTRVETTESNTLRWATEVCMPIIERLCMAHDVNTHSMEVSMRRILRRLDNGK